MERFGCEECASEVGWSHGLMAEIECKKEERVCEGDRGTKVVDVDVR